MTKVHCDHCGESEKKVREVEIKIGYYKETTDLCPTCEGELIHIVGSFIMGDKYKRVE